MDHKGETILFVVANFGQPSDDTGGENFVLQLPAVSLSGQIPVASV